MPFIKLMAATEPIAETSFRYVYVVDPSCDSRAEILRDLAERDGRVSVIVMSRRFVHQGALVAGLDASEGDAVIMLDNDLQHPPSLIQGLVQHWRNGADIAPAVRQSEPETKFYKRQTSDYFYGLFDQMAGMPIKPAAAGYRLLARKSSTRFGINCANVIPFCAGRRQGGLRRRLCAVYAECAGTRSIELFDGDPHDVGDDRDVPLLQASLAVLHFAWVALCVLGVIGGIVNVGIYFL